MQFCEKCNYATSESRCPSCGNEKLRAVQGDDFCFFVDLDALSFSMFENALKQNDIDVVGVPCYSSGVTYATAGRANGRMVYIRYRDTEQAIDIYEIMFGSDEE